MEIDISGIVKVPVSFKTREFHVEFRLRPLANGPRLSAFPVLSHSTIWAPALADRSFSPSILITISLELAIYLNNLVFLFVIYNKKTKLAN